mgnify:CR=1 FL=1
MNTSAANHPACRCGSEWIQNSYSTKHLTCLQGHRWELVTVGFSGNMLWQDVDLGGARAYRAVWVHVYEGG